MAGERRPVCSALRIKVASLNLINIVTQNLQQNYITHYYRPFCWNAFEVLGPVGGVRVEPERGQRASIVHDAWVHSQLRRKTTSAP